jgi:putative membrane protein
VDIQSGLGGSQAGHRREAPARPHNIGHVINGELTQRREPVAEHEPDYRFSLANERTFLAWIRTALALLAGAVAVVALIPKLGFEGAHRLVGVLLTAMGAALALGALRRWQVCQVAMRRDDELPPSRMPLLLAAGLGVLSVVVVALLLLPELR